MSMLRCTSPALKEHASINPALEVCIGDGRFTEVPAAAGRDKVNPKDRRFAGEQWEHPVFDLMRQSYQMMSEYMIGAARKMEHLSATDRAKLEFAVRTLVETMSPANSPLTTPVALEKAIETKGQSLVTGVSHLLRDMQRGQLTHTDPDAFELGRNIACTPGKVVHQTPLYQLIQYTPSTDAVFETPLVIFPPWINRFYILDLTAEKSFIKWCVDAGITVFVVSWKSADGSMRDVVWDDYIASQIDAIDTICTALKVPDVHTIGYCVAGTTLAATLAILAAKGEAAKVRSATFFTAQVDFSRGGELLNFIDEQQLKMIEALASPQGYLDGRFLALTFNLLRGNDLIWSTVNKHYLLGEEYPAFDLLHWNGDVTNLPAKWHKDYLCDLYRDNKLVVGTWHATRPSQGQNPILCAGRTRRSYRPCRKRVELAQSFFWPIEIPAGRQRPYRRRCEPAGAGQISILDQ